jgi:2-methylcitrate dehydratase PrpD
MMRMNDFIHRLQWEMFPGDVKNQARRCLLDTLGAAMAGRLTGLSQIVHDYAAAVHPGTHVGGVSLWQDGRRVTAPGAALANAFTIDSFDIHDGHKLVKGHAGAAVIPAIFASLEDDGRAVPGKELLTRLVVGYEVALRAGMALHRTACDYHTSGAWNALGCAAVCARSLGMDEEPTRHALGIAEYHGPRSQMMRDIDYPTMVKDGSGWGAHVGVSAALLAKGGFTGAPAITVEGTDVADLWSDLGETWRLREVYFKPYAVCYWAQPAVVAVLGLKKTAKFRAEQVVKIRIATFHQAVRLGKRIPKDTEEAQYSLSFPVAAALVFGQLGIQELIGENLRHPEVLRLAGCMEVVEDAGFSALFPAQRLAVVEIELKDGRVLRSEPTQTRWEPSQPPSDEEILEKYRWLSGGFRRMETERIEEMVWNCAELEEVGELVDLLGRPL